MSNKIKLLSINTRGLNDCVKRKTFLNYCRHQKIDIIFAQETFLTTENSEKLKSECKHGSAYCNNFTNHSRGVMIIIQDESKIEFEKISQYSSDDSRILVVVCKIMEHKFALACVYASNDMSERKRFFQKVNKIVNEKVSPDCELVIGGDFNLALENIDRKNPIIRSDYSKCTFDRLRTDHNLVDVLRKTYLDEKIFTYRNQSRIDYIMVSENLSHCTHAQKPTYVPKCPDHRGVSIDIIINNEKRGPGYWKFNSSLLSNPNFVHQSKK